MKDAGEPATRTRRRSTPQAQAIPGPSVEERDAIRRAFLAMALAHEIKQPLHSLNLNLELLNKRLSRGTLTGVDVAAPLDAIGRVVDRINSCLEAVSVRLVPDPVDQTRPRDLRPILAAVVQRAGVDARRTSVKVVAQVRPDVPSLPMDPAHLAVALDALVLNAIQASRRGGNVEITASRIGEDVAIVISDEGEGMAPDVLRRAVEIGFSTRGGDGTGMTVAKFVAYHHLGGFHVESRAGHGTTVTVTLPLSVEGEPDA